MEILTRVARVARETRTGDARRWLDVASHVVRRPRHGAHWVRQRFDGPSALDMGLPWIAWPALDYLRRTLRPGMRVFEYGAGGSTIFFASAGCEITSVEHNPEWGRMVSERLATMRLKTPAIIKLIPQERASEYARAIRGEWDLILVDGAHRLECIEAARDQLAPGGRLLLDNADFPEYAAAPTMLAGFKRTPFRGLGVGQRRWVTQTDLYERS